MGRGPTRTYHQVINESYVEGTLTCLKPEIIKDQVNIEFPLVLNVEPTNACNLRCTCCPRERTVLHQGTNFMPLETFKRIIDEASGYKQLIMLNLHKDGEPLLHKQLPEMVAYAQKKKVAKIIHLNTNGTLLHTRRGQRLLESGIDDITISIDAALPETYLNIKRRHNLEALNQAIESFIDHRNRIGANTTIRVKIMEFEGVTPEEIKIFHDRWRHLADQVQVTGAHDWSGAIEDLTITDETSPVRYPCALLWYALAVNSNGKVSICNVDWDYSGVVGDIRAKNLHQIWNCRDIRKVRRQHLNSNWSFVAVCNLCVVWTSVGDLKSYLQSRTEFI